VVFSEDGHLVLTAEGDGTAQLSDTSTGEVVQAFKTEIAEPPVVAISDNGTVVATGTKTGVIQLWDTRSGRELGRVSHDTHRILSLAFSHDGQSLLTTNWVGAVLWSTRDLQVIHLLKGHYGGVLAGSFSPDGRQIATGGPDDMVRIWDASTGAEILQLLVFAEGNWVAIDPRGRFDIWNNGGKDYYVYWVAGLETIELDQLKELYYDPGLLAKKLNRIAEPLLSVPPLSSLALFPRITVNQPTPQDPVLRVSLENRDGGIGRVSVHVNGKELETDVRPRGADPNARHQNLNIALSSYSRWLSPSTPNKIVIHAFNADGSLSSRGRIVIVGPLTSQPAQVPDLWAIVSGISRYGGNDISLRYPAKDAADVAKSISLAGKALFGSDHLHVKLLSTDGGPSEAPIKANLRAAFEDLRRAAPTDIVVVYLSGHGIDYQDQYYYPTGEATSLNVESAAVRESRAISGEELSRWLRDSPAHKQVVILDTCAAGAASKRVSLRPAASPQTRSAQSSG
jgi:WD40 repeat protein